MSFRRLLAIAGLLVTLVSMGTVATACENGNTTTTQGAPTTATPVSSIAPASTTTAGLASSTTLASSTATVSTAVVSSATVTTSSAVVSSTTSPPGTTTVPRISPDVIAYAESLGGISHQGETLYLVIGTTIGSQSGAMLALDRATPLFGDMQSYFIVQRSDSFEGLQPGYWVVIEAYYDEPPASELDFGRRGFPEAYVRQVKVLTADPIPVYEDAIGLTQIAAMREAIVASGLAGANFEIYDYLISEDGEWAGVSIGVPDLQNAVVLMSRIASLDWKVVDVGTTLNYSDIIAKGAPEEIADFLTCFT